MNRFLRFIILLIGAAGLSSCGAVSSGFVFSDETFLKAEPSRVVYSIRSQFDKKEDLAVYLYRADGGISRVPIEDVITTLDGDPHDVYTFGEDDPGTWEIGVGYANLEPAKYVITVLSAEEQAYYDNGGKTGITITIIGP